MFSFRKEQRVNENHFDRQYYDFFILRQHGLNDSNIRFQTSEVQSIKFATMSEINKMREEGLMVERDECYNCLSEYLFRM